MAETNFKLRSNIFASTVITTPTAGYTAGQMVKVNDLVGVIVETKTAGQDAVLCYSAEKIVVPKTVATAEVMAVGNKVYFVSGTAKVSKSSTGNTLCGRVTVAAGAVATEVEIDLKGNVAA